MRGSASNADTAAPARPSGASARQANRHLKNVLIGAAKSAIAQRENLFADQYQKGIERGLTARNARRTVARHQASVLWGMWKSDTEYRPELLTGDC